ncbi:MAG: hypothetical protein MI892_27030, partial [Desulfobacterales bacterium]|nr:hypothetical protein [Desulfobacterales bacterium]
AKAIPTYFKMVWQTGILPLFTIITDKNAGLVKTVNFTSQVITAISFVFGAGYSFYKRQWFILGLLIFLIPYSVIHVAYYMIPRYISTITWIIILISFYGLQNFWSLLNNINRIPAFAVILLQVITGISAIFWLFSLFPHIPKYNKFSPSSSQMYIAGGIAALAIFIGHMIINKRKDTWQMCMVSIWVIMMIVSNHFSVATTVRDGQRDAEFRDLAYWYNNNAEPGEKMATTMSNILSLFSPENRTSFVHIGGIKPKQAEKADDPMEFVKQCYERNITYVAWDSRLGFSRGTKYYNLWGLEKCLFLYQPKDNGPFTYITQIKNQFYPKRFINIFELRDRSTNQREK